MSQSAVEPNLNPWRPSVKYFKLIILKSKVKCQEWSAWVKPIKILLRQINNHRKFEYVCGLISLSLYSNRKNEKFQRRKT